MFNGPKLTREIRDLLLQGEFAKASAVIHQDLSVFPKGEYNRIRQLRQLYSSVREAVDTPPEAGEERIQLKSDLRKPVLIDVLPTDVLTLPPGVYASGHQATRASSFDVDFPNLSEEDTERFKISRFHTPLEEGTRSEFRIVRDAFICGSQHMMNAYAYEDKQYAQEESGRIAKSCGLNTYSPAKEILKKALLLPIPHHAGNYYHVMAEMIYGLRMTSRVAPDTPIIYQEDRFNILPYICRILKIDTERLIPFKNARFFRFETALIPRQPPYFWNESVFEFFRQFVRDTSGPLLKIYVSRRFSGRGPKNESEIEDHLAQRGFIILHSEHLNFEQQITLFSQATFVVSAHGAGLTNIAFMRPETTMIEMFPPHMLTRDFYMRSRHNKMAYGGIIFEDTVQMDKFQEMLDRHQL